MDSMAEQRRRRAAEARPFVIFLAFMIWVLFGGIGRVVTGGDMTVAHVMFVVAVLAVAITELILRKW